MPAERLVTERELLAPLPSLRASIGRLVTRKVDRLACVRFGSARYSVPMRLVGEQVGLRTDDGRLLVIVTATGEVIAEHTLVAPGEASILDAHYGGPRPVPRRAVRPKTLAEKQFCALGPVAEAFITGAAAAGNTRLGPELAQLNMLPAAHGDQALLDALGRAVAFGRWHAADVRSILAAGAGTPHPSPAGQVLVLELPVVPVRSLAEQQLTATRTDTATNRRCPMSTTRAGAGRGPRGRARRLKLAAMRQLAPELLRTATTQRWAPEELLRTLIEAEIAARDASNDITR